MKICQNPQFFYRCGDESMQLKASVTFHIWRITKAYKHSSGELRTKIAFYPFCDNCHTLYRSLLGTSGGKTAINESIVIHHGLYVGNISYTKSMTMYHLCGDPASFTVIMDKQEHFGDQF